MCGGVVEHHDQSVTSDLRPSIRLTQSSIQIPEKGLDFLGCDGAISESGEQPSIIANSADGSNCSRLRRLEDVVFSGLPHPASQPNRPGAERALVDEDELTLLVPCHSHEGAEH